MKIKTISWVKNRIKIIDQTKLPNKLKYIYISKLEDLFEAIRVMRIRGAPALGAAAALGLMLAVHKSSTKRLAQFKKEIEQAACYLGKSRPTAVNLFWALNRMKQVMDDAKLDSISKLKRALLKESAAIIEQDRLICRKMAAHGAKLIKNGDTVLTVCNAGILATVDYGTALGVMYRAKQEKKRFKVFASETRPLLQGARLTTWELLQNKIDVTLICDNQAAGLMKKKLIDKIFVGADRIACNGDTANKVGTYNLAVLAKWHKVPFYVVAPLSTFDKSIKTGKQIPIEQRCSTEVTHNLFKVPVAPRGVKVLNPAFDVTPHELITAFVTEKGILRPPYGKKISKI